MKKIHHYQKTNPACHSRALFCHPRALFCHPRAGGDPGYNSIFYILWQMILKRKIMLISFFILIFFLPIAYLTTRYTSKTEAAWMDDNWAYRKSIAVTNNTTQQTNVYISTTLDTSDTTRFKANCGDLRYTNAGGKQLKYYIVSGCTTVSTVIHVLLDVFPAGSQYIYYYYGNPSAVNGFSSSDFSIVASNYTIGSFGSEEKSTGPVAYWKFDEGYGTQTKDSTQSGDNGSISNATWQSEDQCVNGKCLYFNGSNSSVTVSTVNNIKFDQPHTFSAWFTYRGFQTGNNGGKGGLFTTTGGPRIYTADSSSNALCLQETVSICTGNLQDNTWYHYAYTWDGATARIYINGIQVNTGAITLTAISNLTIGYTQWYHKGIIDDVKIYNYARSAAQIKADFASKGNGSVKGTSVALGSNIKNLGSLSDGLVGYWKMDEASGNAIDSSGNGNTGTANGTTVTTGKFGNGRRFNGTSDNIAISYTNPVTATSVVAWFKKIGTPNGGYHIITGGQNVEISINDPGGYIRTGVTTATQGRQVFNSGSGLIDGNWHQVAMTYDGTSLKSFIDGAQTASNPVSGNLSGTAGEIGRYLSNAYVANGIINDVRIYNRALSPKEIRDLYNWAPGPVGYWNFEEGTGGTVYDKSGNGINGSWNGTGTTHYTGGKYGKAANFNGVDDYVSVNNNTLLNPSTLTVSAWAKSNSAMWNDYGFIVSKRDVYIIHPNQGATSVSFYIYAGGWKAVNCTPPNITNWHYYTLSWDGTNLSCYIDGIKGSSNAPGGSINTSDTGELDIGKDDGIARYLNGQIDEVKIYNYVRSSKQIVEDMNGGHPAGGSPVGSQAGYWKFDEGYGTVVNDSGPNTLALSLVNSASWTNAGKFGKALSLNGASQRQGAQRVDNAALNPGTGSFTTSAWIKTSQTGSWKRIVTKRGSSTTWYSMAMTSNKLAFETAVTYPTYYTSSSGSTTINDGNWHYVAMVRDTTQSKVLLYVDGKQDVSVTDNTAGQSITNTEIFEVGTWGTEAYDSGSYTGQIDEVKFYNSALTADEIKIDYNRGAGMVLGTSGNNASYDQSAANQQYCVPGDATSCAAPVGEWNFEEKSTASAYDTSGNNVTLTATGLTSSNIVPGKVGSAYKYTTWTQRHTGTAISVCSTSTMEAWVYPLTTPSERYTIILQNGISGQYLSIDSSNSVSAYWYGKSVEGYHSSGSNTVPNNTWTHIATTWDANGINIYVNGVLKNFVASTGSPCTGTSLIIGAENSGRQMNGYIDQVKIFNYARTPAQIAWDYNRGGPVGWWKLDECQGGTANDSSGNGNSGSITIGATGSQTSPGTCTDGLSTSAWNNGKTGKYNASLNFDGVDDIVSTSYNSIFDITNSITLSAWYKKDVGSGTNRWLIDKGPVNSSYAMFIEGGLKMRLEKPGMQDCTITEPSEGVWHHAVSTYDGSSMKIYVDGQLMNTCPGTGTISTSGGGINIGAYAGPGYMFKGQIDDVRVYNYALTAAQIKNLYNGGGAMRFGPASGSP